MNKQSSIQYFAARDENIFRAPHHDQAATGFPRSRKPAPLPSAVVTFAAASETSDERKLKF